MPTQSESTLSTPPRTPPRRKRSNSASGTPSKQQAPTPRRRRGSNFDQTKLVGGLNERHQFHQWLSEQLPNTNESKYEIYQKYYEYQAAALGFQRDSKDFTEYGKYVIEQLLEHASNLRPGYDFIDSILSEWPSNTIPTGNLDDAMNMTFDNLVERLLTANENNGTTITDELNTFMKMAREVLPTNANTITRIEAFEAIAHSECATTSTSQSHSNTDSGTEPTQEEKATFNKDIAIFTPKPDEGLNNTQLYGLCNEYYLLLNNLAGASKALVNYAQDRIKAIVEKHSDDLKFALAFIDDAFKNEQIDLDMPNLKIALITAIEIRDDLKLDFIFKAGRIIGDLNAVLLRWYADNPQGYYTKFLRASYDGQSTLEEPFKNDANLSDQKHALALLKQINVEPGGDRTAFSTHTSALEAFAIAALLFKDKNLLSCLKEANVINTQMVASSPHSRGANSEPIADLNSLEKKLLALKSSDLSQRRALAEISPWVSSLYNGGHAGNQHFATTQPIKPVNFYIRTKLWQALHTCAEFEQNPSNILFSWPFDLIQRLASPLANNASRVSQANIAIFGRIFKEARAENRKLAANTDYKLNKNDILKLQIDILIRYLEQHDVPFENWGNFLTRAISWEEHHSGRESIQFLNSAYKLTIDLLEKRLLTHSVPHPDGGHTCQLESKLNELKGRATEEALNEADQISELTNIYKHFDIIIPENFNVDAFWDLFERINTNNAEIPWNDLNDLFVSEPLLVDLPLCFLGGPGNQVQTPFDALSQSGNLPTGFFDSTDTWIKTRNLPANIKPIIREISQKICQLDSSNPSVSKRAETWLYNTHFTYAIRSKHRAGEADEAIRYILDTAGVELEEKLNTIHRFANEIQESRYYCNIIEKIQNPAHSIRIALSEVTMNTSGTNKATQAAKAIYGETCGASLYNLFGMINQDLQDRDNNLSKLHVLFGSSNPNMTYHEIFVLFYHKPQILFLPMSIYDFDTHELEVKTPIQAFWENGAPLEFMLDCLEHFTPKVLNTSKQMDFINPPYKNHELLNVFADEIYEHLENILFAAITSGESSDKIIEQLHRVYKICDQLDAATQTQEASSGASTSSAPAVETPTHPFRFELTQYATSIIQNAADSCLDPVLTADPTRIEALLAVAQYLKVPTVVTTPEDKLAEPYGKATASILTNASDEYSDEYSDAGGVGSGTSDNGREASYDGSEDSHEEASEISIKLNLPERTTEDSVNSDSRKTDALMMAERCLNNMAKGNVFGNIAPAIRGYTSKTVDGSRLFKSHTQYGRDRATELSQRLENLNNSLVRTTTSRADLLDEAAPSPQNSTKFIDADNNLTPHGKVSLALLHHFNEGSGNWHTDSLKTYIVTAIMYEKENPEKRQKVSATLNNKSARKLFLEHFTKILELKLKQEIFEAVQPTGKQGAQIAEHTFRNLWREGFGAPAAPFVPTPML